MISSVNNYTCSCIYPFNGLNCEYIDRKDDFL
jgi:hypothetical protein